MKPIVRLLENLRQTALRRLPGYMEEILKRGQLSEDGKTVRLTRADFNYIRQTYNPRAGRVKINAGCC